MSSISGTRRALLLKVISKPQPGREAVEGVVELTAGKVVDMLEAQSMIRLKEADGQAAPEAEPTAAPAKVQIPFTKSLSHAPSFCDPRPSAPLHPCPDRQHPMAEHRMNALR